MADMQPDIQPAAPDSTPAPSSPPPAAPATSQQQPDVPQLPPDLLKIHAIQGLISGAPAAVSMDIKDFAKTENGKTIAKNGQSLQQAGLGFYKSFSGDTGVIFNQLYIHPQDLQQADKMGKLSQVAPPWSKVDHAISKAGAAHPALTHRGAPLAPAGATPPPVPQAATGIIQPPGKPLPAKAQNQLLHARILASQPSSPTAGPAAGTSQLLASVLKPVV